MSYELILNHVARHIQLNGTEVEFFISLLNHKTIEKKDFLLKEGDTCRTEQFITNGCLKVYTVDNNGFEHIKMFGVEDWWVGDLYSFLTQTPANFFISAIEKTDLLQTTKENLEKLYERVPKFERFFRILFQNAFIAQQQRINQNLSFTAEERYLQFIHKYPRLEQRIPQKQVAAYLGISPEFLSVLRRKMMNHR